MIDSVIERSGVSRRQFDAVAVGQGPGSFTGLRIGIGVAQGIAYGAGCPMIGVSSLTALAQQAVWLAPSTEAVWAAIDARMGEIYFARYQNLGGSLTQDGATLLLAPGAIPTDEWSNNVSLAGNAWAEYREQLGADLPDQALPNNECLLPNASAVLSLANLDFANQRWIDPKLFEPDYVRNNVAKVKGE